MTVDELVRETKLEWPNTKLSDAILKRLAELVLKEKR